MGQSSSRAEQSKPPTIPGGLAPYTLRGVVTDNKTGLRLNGIITKLPDINNPEQYTSFVCAFWLKQWTTKFIELCSCLRSLCSEVNNAQMATSENSSSFYNGTVEQCTQYILLIDTCIHLPVDDDNCKSLLLPMFVWECTIFSACPNAQL